MTLDEYLSANKLSDGKFAERAGVDRSTISRIRRGTLNTTRDVMLRVIAASEHQVTAASLVQG
jgi:transcriptional regulator with XRE-family HTH domain